MLRLLSEPAIGTYRALGPVLPVCKSGKSSDYPGYLALRRRQA